LIQLKSLVDEVRLTVSCIDAKTAINECKNNNGVLIDVREPDEFSKGAVDISLNIPRGILEMKVLALYPEPTQMIYIYCASGARATLATEQLNRLGYENVKAITCKLADVIKHSCIKN